MAKSANLVELAIGGRRFGGWTEVSITRSLDSLSGQFTLALAERATAEEAALAIGDGDRCAVMIDGETVIDGWIDTVATAIAGTDHSIQVGGRDRTADLADCSAIHKPGSWAKMSIEAIAAELTKPFGISVAAKAATGTAIPKFALQQGESVQAALERLLRFRGLLMIANVTGDLEIITPETGSPVATLELGVNILAATGSRDQRERFSEYVVKGQASGNDEKNGKTVSQISGTAKDSGVKRYRPLLIVAEEQSDRTSAGARAKWEGGVRAGRSVTAEIDVLGWRAPGGALWRPNRQVRVKCAPIRMADETMLIESVTFEKGAGGTITRLGLVPASAWQQLAEGAPR